MTNGANASYVNVNFAAYVLYMRFNSHVICKMEYEVFAVVENDMTLFKMKENCILNIVCIYLDVYVLNNWCSG